jgi:hypothetical protein
LLFPPRNSGCHTLHNIGTAFPVTSHTSTFILQQFTQGHSLTNTGHSRHLSFVKDNIFRQKDLSGVRSLVFRNIKIHVAVWFLFRSVKATNKNHIYQISPADKSTEECHDLEKVEFTFMSTWVRGKFIKMWARNWQDCSSNASILFYFTQVKSFYLNIWI